MPPAAGGTAPAQDRADDLSDTPIVVADDHRGAVRLRGGRADRALGNRGQAEGEGAAPSELALDPDLAAVLDHDAAADRQPEPGPTLLRPSRSRP